MSQSKGKCFLYYSASVMDTIQQGTHQFTWKHQNIFVVSSLAPNSKHVTGTDQHTCALPEYGVRSWGHCTVSETITLAQPPYAEKEKHK